MTKQKIAIFKNNKYMYGGYELISIQKYLLKIINLLLDNIVFIWYYISVKKNNTQQKKERE
jgi:hypothetical protein